MAENKKSVIVYTDLIHVVKKLIIDDRDKNTNNAGELFYHFLQYVNDINPEPINMIVDISFEPIKQQLKRDLKKWEVKSEIRSDAGRIGGIASGEARRIKREQNEANEANALKSKQNEHVNVTVNVSDTVNVSEIKDYKKVFLSEINSDDYPNLKIEYIEIAKSFQKLFIKNQNDAGITNSILEKAKGTWIDDIRLLIETDEKTEEQCRLVWKFLSTNNFWKSNILSTKKLREKFDTLLIQLKNNGKESEQEKNRRMLNNLTADLDTEIPK